MTIDHLVTHSGSFHADEVCAYTILHDLYPNATLTRTRDESLIAQQAPNGIVFDVGRVYDHSQRRYDHHQPDAPIRADGMAYAAFGLVWEHYGQDWLREAANVPTPHIAGVHAQMAAGFVRDVDSADVGATPPGFSHATSLSGLVHAHNPATMGLDGAPHTHTDAQIQGRFLEAAALARSALHNHAQLCAREHVAQHLVETAAQNRTHPAILVLDRPMPWEKAVIEHPSTQDVLLVVSPNSGMQDWGVTCARTSLEGFESRRLLPQSWRGKTGQDLQQVSGVGSATFCHTAGFYAAITTQKDALVFAQNAVGLWAREDRIDRAKALAHTDPPATRPTKMAHKSHNER